MLMASDNGNVCGGSFLATYQSLSLCAAPNLVLPGSGVGGRGEPILYLILMPALQ